MPDILNARRRRGTPRRPLVARRAAFVSMFVSLLVALPVRAQLPPAPLPLSNTEDARTLPAGVVRFRALNAWTRFDNVFGGLGDTTRSARQLGALFSADDFGIAHLPFLSGAEEDLRTLTGDANLRVNVGRLTATANSRVVTTPLSLEYGVFDRLTVGVMVPVVETHSTVFVELNPRGTTNNANVGPNPAQLGLATARSQNAALIGALADASARLTEFLAACGATPGSCSPDQVARATAARARADQVEDTISRLYGAANEGSMFVPLGGSDAQAAVVSAIAALQAEVNAVLGANLSFGEPFAAAGRAALSELQSLATDPDGAAFDSLGSPDRIGVGDVEVSAAVRLFDSFGDTLGRDMRVRAAVRGVLRLGTGRPSDGRVPFEIGTGTGQTSADIAGIFDFKILPRLMATFAGQYTAYFGSAKVGRVPSDEFGIFPLDVPVAGTWRAGNSVQVEATPRLLLTDYFTLHGHYTLRRQEPSTYESPSLDSSPLFEASTEQRVGLGIAYSTLARYARGRTRVPIELLFSHLQTIAARGGLTPQYTRAQIELRIYYRLRRGAR